MTTTKIRPMHFVPNARLPLRTACGAGRHTKRWKSVDATVVRADVTCGKCQRTLQPLRLVGGWRGTANIEGVR